MKKSFLYAVLLVLSVFSSTMHSHASMGAEFPIATTAVAISAAFDGTNYLVGLEYNHNGTADQINTHVGAQMISSTGAKIGSVIETSQHGIAQSIAFDGTNYLMVWEDNQGLSPTNCNFALYGQFISKAGTAVGTSFVISSGIEFDGINILSYGSGKYLVTYTKLINVAQCENSTNRYIAGHIISPDGTMGSEFRISTGNGAKNSMTFDGTNFFVVWVEDSQDYEVRGRFVSPRGALGTEISINATTAPSDNIPPTVAFDGINYMVVWNDKVGGYETRKWDVFGQRVSPNGALVGGVITITSEPGKQMATSIAFDGANYFAVWIDMKNDTDKDGVCDAGEGTCWDVYGQYISKDGALVGNKVAISTDAGNQLGVAGYNNGKYLVVVSSGIVLGEDGITQGGDVYGMFITPPSTIPALKYILTVIKAGTGNGDITSSPSGIDCGSVCSAEYDQGTVVTLTPVSDTGSLFAGWSGGGCSGSGTCITTINADTTITSTFTTVQTGNPKISVSPMSVNFGSMKIGDTSNPKTITIRNTGKGYLTINSITITGTNAGEFNQTNGCSTITSGNSCAINATFTPTTPFGAKSATISISSNDPKKPTINVKLLGKAAPPKISASPKSVNFGSVQVGNTSSPKIITIKNTGISDLVISDINITGTNAGEFNQTNGCSTITSGNSCTINATFTPTTPSGAKSATISISSNDPKKPTVTVKIKGKATTPVSGESFTKGNVTLKASVATSGSTKTVTVTDSHGKTVLTLHITTSTATFTFPEISTPTIINFDPPLSELPTDYTAKRMAIYAAGQISSSSTISSSSRKVYLSMNNPGCDWFPDTQCTLSCCAVHDLCYAENACTAKSWVVNFDGSFTTDCSKCNSIVMNCIAGACKGIDEYTTANNCYDTRCGKFYDCPPNYNTCGCKDICADSGITVPSTCGNGKCDSGETLSSCPGDCVYCGNGTCDSGETSYSCPSDCGACGTGPFDCIPGGSMQYEPCYPEGFKTCGANCKWGPCMCGDNFDHQCTSTCTYTYSDWSACQSNNTQTRTVVSQSPDGCTGTPVLSQACTYNQQTCTYTYSDWSACQSNNTQTRTVLSSSPAGCTGTPVLSQACTYSDTPSAGNYMETCTATINPFTCCSNGSCYTIPGYSYTASSDTFTIESGTSLSQFTSDVCADARPALSAAGCTSSSCSVTASTSTSAIFNLSCTVPQQAGCGIATVTEICTLSRQ